MSTEAPRRGITFLDHTADVGLEVRAPSLPELFTQTATGTLWLIQGRDRDAPGAESGAAQPAVREGGVTAPVDRPLTLSAEDLPTLLRAWLRELLHWHELEGLAFHSARFTALDETRLEASVRIAPDPQEPIREIKGVTLHGLLAERRDATWTARVIFDV